jgi:hypothetical protein
MAPEVYKWTVTWSGNLGSLPAYNIHHIQIDTLSLTDMNNVNVALKNFYDAMKAYIPSSVNVTVGSSVVQVSGGPPTIIPVAPLTLNGTDTSGNEPPQCAVVISWRSSLATREGRGRTFFGPVGAAGSTNFGVPQFVFSTLLQTKATALISDLAALTPPAQKVIWGPSAGAHVVGSALVRGGSFHTQRRRAVK